MPIVNASLVRDVIDALKAAFTLYLPTNFAISVGQPPGGDIPAEYAAIAYGGENRPDATGTTKPSEWGNRGDVIAEEFAIWCCISTSSGNQDGSAQMAQTDGYYQSVAVGLLNNQSLSGLLVTGSFIDLGQYEWYLDEGGSVASLFFQVIVTVPFLR